MTTNLWPLIFKTVFKVTYDNSVWLVHPKATNEKLDKL